MFKFHLSMIVYSTERITGKSNAVGRLLHYTHVHHSSPKYHHTFRCLRNVWPQKLKNSSSTRFIFDMFTISVASLI